MERSICAAWHQWAMTTSLTAGQSNTKYLPTRCHMKCTESSGNSFDRYTQCKSNGIFRASFHFTGNTERGES